MRRRVEGAGLFRRVSVELREEDGDDVSGSIERWLKNAADNHGFGLPEAVAQLQAAGEVALAEAPPGGWPVLDDPRWWLAEIALECRDIETGEAAGNVDLVKRSAFQLGQLCTQLQAKAAAEPAWYRVKADLEKHRSAQRAATKVRTRETASDEERAAAVDGYRERHPAASVAEAALRLSRDRPELGAARTIRKAVQKVGLWRAKGQK